MAEAVDGWGAQKRAMPVLLREVLGHLLMPLLLLGLLGGLNLWLYAPAWTADPPFLIGSNPDIFASVWVFVLSAARQTVGPLTFFLEPPQAAVAMPAGAISVRLLSPLLWWLDPVTGYDVAICLLVAGGVMSTALLARDVTGRWAPGVFLSVTLLAQPPIHQLVRDGSLENLTFWILPALLLAVRRAVRLGRRRPALLAGFVFSLIPFDGPYNAAYALIALPLALTPELYAMGRAKARGQALGMTGKGLARLVGWAGLGAMPILLLAIWLFTSADLGQVGGRAVDVAARNSLELQSWTQLVNPRPPDSPPPPAGAALPLPGVGLWLLALSLVGLPRSGPWLVFSLLSFGLALGPGESNVRWLEVNLGAPGLWLGAGMAQVSAALTGIFPFSFVRFPRRWVVVSLLAGVWAASCGLSRGLTLLETVTRRVWSRRKRIRAQAPVGQEGAMSAELAGRPRGLTGLALTLVLGGLIPGLLGVWQAQALVTSTGYRSAIPGIDPPLVAACRYLATQPGEGAVLLLPGYRHRHSDGSEIFGGLDPYLVAFDRQWLQVQHGRPQTYLLETIPTVFALGQPPPLVAAWRKAADQVARQAQAGAPIPDALWQSWMDDGLPTAGVAALREAGYRFLLVDKASYPDESLEALVWLVGDAGRTAMSFPDGSGLLVFDLHTPGTAAPASPPRSAP